MPSNRRSPESAMTELIYSVLASLDGYVEDESGRFDWAAPVAEVHAFVNELERPVGTHLYGRRMYETMRYWEDPPGLAEAAPYIQDYAAIWQAADKVVYSRTLQSAPTARTRIEREFDPEGVRRLKAEATGGGRGRRAAGAGPAGPGRPPGRGARGRRARSA